MKKAIYILSLLFATSYSVAQTTAIPDVNFETALINLGYDTGSPDGFVPTANIDTIINLNVSNKNISDLTGIEDFTALTSLNCSSNLLINLNLTQNASLTVLNCSDNLLTNIDVTQNTGLASFLCTDNQLTNLNITQNTSLTSLSCGLNQLTSLDVSQNTALTVLNCHINFITTLDISQNTGLTGFDCSSNQLTSIDVSQNSMLINFYCFDNQILSIDVSQNPMLNTLNCVVNQLSSLDVRNGNNSNVVLFDAGSNPNLDCIYVDDKNASYLTLPVWNKDASTYWANDSLDCQTIISVDEYSLKQKVLLYPNPTNNNIIIKLNEEFYNKDISIEIYDIVGQLSYSNSIKNHTNNNLTINVSHFPKGIFLVKLQMGEKVYSDKFFKQ